MSANQYPVIAAVLAIGSLLCGCNAGSDTELTELSVYGLTEAKSVDACAEQVLTVTSDSSLNTHSVYTWNVDAPADASFSFEPNADELHFVARTPGNYSISVTQCPAEVSTEGDCSVTEFAVSVVTGPDTNGNNVGDACEARDCVPACEGRSCGIDPVCGKSCGVCGTGQTCDDSTGQCEAECIPACEGRTCGLDPICGKSCGSCGSGQTCNETIGQCIAECVPACAGRVCGLDPLCHTSCGTCADGSACNDQGKCEAAQQPGRVVTIVMALTDKRLAITDPHSRQRARLIERSVQWVSPVDDPQVLVVLDDSCSDWSKEAKWIRSTLAKRGIAASFINEPAGGLSVKQLDGFDVVWFTNPALPVDDEKTILTLAEFARSGGGLVLQGDDITQPTKMQSLTHLRNTGNGKEFCGQHYDDDRGASYTVRVERNNHPITASLLGNTYYYGDDIDSSTLVADANATVLAWAQVGCRHHNRSGSPRCEKQPVIVAYDMNQ